MKKEDEEELEINMKVSIFLCCLVLRRQLKMGLIKGSRDLKNKEQMALCMV